MYAGGCLFKQEKVSLSVEGLSVTLEKAVIWVMSVVLAGNSVNNQPCTGGLAPGSRGGLTRSSLRATSLNWQNITRILIDIVQDLI